MFIVGGRQVFYPVPSEQDSSQNFLLVAQQHRFVLHYSGLAELLTLSKILHGI